MFTRHKLLSTVALLLSRAAWHDYRKRAIPRAAKSFLRAPISEALLLRGMARDCRSVLRQGSKPAMSFSMASLAVLLGLSSFTMLALAALIQRASEAYPPESWRVKLEQRLGVAILDATGRINLGPLQNSQDRAVVATPSAVPEHCIDLVLASEDKNWDAPWHIWGVDVLSLRHIVTGSRGASTIPMEVARILGDWRAKLPVHERKLAELGAAKAIVDLHGGDMRRVARTFLAIAPMAVAYGEVNGLEAFSQGYFQKPAVEMSRAECAFAVASLPSPLNLGRDSEIAHTVFASVVRRAGALVGRVYPGDATVIRDLASIESAGLPSSRRTFFGRTGAVALNLTARSNAFLGPIQSRIVSDTVGMEQDHDAH